MEKLIKNLKAKDAKYILEQLIEHVQRTIDYEQSNPLVVDDAAADEVCKAVIQCETPSIVDLSKWTTSIGLHRGQEGRVNFANEVLKVITSAHEYLEEMRRIDREVDEEVRQILAKGKELQNA